MENFASKVNKMVETGKLSVSVNNKSYTLELKNGEIEIAGIGNLYDKKNGLLKDKVDERLVDLIRNLEEFVEYKTNGIDFVEVWGLVAEAKETNNYKKLEFAKEFLNIDNEVIKVADKLDDMSLDGDLELSDDEIDNITFEEAKNLTENEISHDYEIGR